MPGFAPSAFTTMLRMTNVPVEPPEKVEFENQVEQVLSTARDLLEHYHRATLDPNANTVAPKHYQRLLAMAQCVLATLNFYLVMSSTGAWDVTERRRLPIEEVRDELDELIDTLSFATDPDLIEDLAVAELG